jgi:hypothetical protein
LTSEDNHGTLNLFQIFEQPPSVKKDRTDNPGDGIVIRKRCLFFFKIMLFMIILNGCATVPQETVELSHVMEENIAALKISYITLINAHFDLLEETRIYYLENEWIPRFIKEWAADGRLVDIASGRVVWSDEHGGFIQPERGLEMEGLFASTASWANAAIRVIGEKREELISPLASQRKELLAIVEEGFDRLLRGNMAITAHLSSIRKIKEVQNRALEALKLGDLQKEIDKRLLDFSRYADQGLEAIKKADGFIDTANSWF